MKFQLQNGVLNQVVEFNQVFSTEKEKKMDSIFSSNFIIEAALIVMWMWGIDWFIHLFNWLIPILGGPIGGW